MHGAHCMLNHTVIKQPPSGVEQKLGEGRRVPAQVSSSSSDHSSKLQGASQNNPFVASKQDVNITKLISIASVLEHKLSERTASNH
ncbi:hypothetical protein AVEN_61561-1 [Araneus ventricosus]|uniref:Uncharacterized protein n=1 Tax=Araneus ventricosus TaxID=182803 RepID=A0A4Y2MH61_ARAVE|nr:hypothetical protein AVEN_61561-1 [Araneus ventricosus]